MVVRHWSNQPTTPGLPPTLLVGSAQALALPPPTTAPFTSRDVFETGARPGTTIRDLRTVRSTLRIDDDIDLDRLRLKLDITHTRRSDLVVKLTSPAGTSVTLSDRAGGDAHDLIDSFDISSAFAGERSQGDWLLTVEDTATGKRGKLKGWSLEASGKLPPPRQELLVLPVGFKTLMDQYGWEEGSWQHNLLKAADDRTGAPDERITVKEINDYLAAPDDLKFVSSGAMRQVRGLVSSGPVAVRNLSVAWQQAVARAADANANGSLTSTELEAYLSKVKKAGPGAATQWMPDQKSAPFDSRIADHTHEADFLTPAGSQPDGVLLTRDYMRTDADTTRRIPHWVSYELTAADMAETPAGIERRNNFSWDPDLKGERGATREDYKGSGWNRGHHKRAEDAVNQDSMDESFLLSNIAPQTSALNQLSWNLLEQATAQLVHATNGKASIVTGGLFLDAQGRPLPAGQAKDWIGANGEKRVAVATHFFKAVLVRLPDGSHKTFAYLCENGTDLGGTKEPQQAKYLTAHRVSVDELEAMLGVDLFSSLDERVQQQIEANADPTFLVPDPRNHTKAVLVWPQD